MAHMHICTLSPSRVQSQESRRGGCWSWLSGPVQVEPTMAAMFPPTDTGQVLVSITTDRLCNQYTCTCTVQYILRTDAPKLKGRKEALVIILARWLVGALPCNIGRRHATVLFVART
jgi:hypothetical protein